MANYKGSAIVFIKKKMALKSEEVRQSFQDSLSDEVNMEYESCLSSNWIPLLTAQIILENAIKILYPGQKDGAQLLGRDRAKEHLTGIYRPILRIAKPSFIIGQTSRVWKTYYDKGVARHELFDEQKKGAMIVEGFPELPFMFREISSGYMQAAVELTGAKNIRVQRDDTNPEAWRWDGSWE